MKVDQATGAVIVAALGLVGTVGGIFAGLRRGRADAQKTSIEGQVIAGSEFRAWTETYRADLAAEREDRRRIETELTAEIEKERAARRALEDELGRVRAELVAERQRSADLARRVEELERLVSGSGPKGSVL